jgi:hypothetical protein
MACYRDSFTLLYPMGERGMGNSTIFILFFIEVTKMIMAETNKYNYNPYLDTSTMTSDIHNFLT